MPKLFAVSFKNRPMCVRVNVSRETDKYAYIADEPEAFIGRLYVPRSGRIAKEDYHFFDTGRAALEWIAAEHIRRAESLEAQATEHRQQAQQILDGIGEQLSRMDAAETGRGGGRAAGRRGREVTKVFKLRDHQMDTVESLVVKFMSLPELKEEYASVQQDVMDAFDTDPAAAARLQRYMDKLRAAIAQGGEAER